MFQQNKSPKRLPTIVPIIPIEVPVSKNILSKLVLPNPMVLSTAISAFFERTSIIIDEIILKAATRIIRVRIKNITFRSTCSAFKKFLFRSIQSKTAVFSGNILIISAFTIGASSGSLI